MGMDRILERIRKGSGPPFRQHELAQGLGYSVRHLRRLIDKGAVETVTIAEGAERRIPVQEARKLAQDAGLMLEIEER